MMVRFGIYTLTLFSCFLFIPLQAAPQGKISLRGAEREEMRFLDPAADALALLTYAPRKAADGIFYGAGQAAAKLSDKDFIRRVKDILYVYDDKILWYPMLEYASGFRPASGLGIRYTEDAWRIHARMALHDSNYNSYSLKPSYESLTPWGEWKSSVLALYEKKDDRRFYGLGADPRNDPRNFFTADHDYGVYTEARRKIQWESSLYKTDQSLGITYLGSYQRRSFEDHGRGHHDLHEIFDHTQIPGFSAPTKQLYNELALTFDTRRQKKIASPGFRSEIYSGISAGLKKNDADLLRAGFDAAGFIPVTQKERLLIPRVVGDFTQDIHGGAIPFSEYPRQHTFRGVSNREMIRSEKVSLVPSLEYRWPLSHMLAGHVFADTLFVGPRADGIRWNQGLWAAGIGMDFHLFKNELARAELAWGSEGVQAMITFGAPLKSNHRKDW